MTNKNEEYNIYNTKILNSKTVVLTSSQQLLNLYLQRAEKKLQLNTAHFWLKQNVDYTVHRKLSSLL